MNAAVVDTTVVFLRAMADSLARHDRKAADDRADPVIFVLTENRVIAWRFKKFVRELHARPHREEASA